MIGGLISASDNYVFVGAKNLSTINTNHQPDTLIKVFDEHSSDWKNYNANLNLQHTLTKDEKVSINVDYLFYRNDNPGDYINSYYNGAGTFLFENKLNSRKITPIQIWVQTIDYTRKLGQKVALEAGIKSTVSTFKNEVQVDKFVQNTWNTDKALSDKYELKENIAAAYALLNIAPDPKTLYKVGLRYEHTNSNLGSASVKNIVDRHYGSLFPSFFISRKLNQENSINFAYSRRITRPAFTELAPFVLFIDPNTFFSGKD